MTSNLFLNFELFIFEDIHCSGYFNEFIAKYYVINTSKDFYDAIEDLLKKNLTQKVTISIEHKLKRRYKIYSKYKDKGFNFTVVIDEKALIVETAFSL